MVHRLQKHGPVLRVLQTAKPNLRKAIISAADKDLVFAICEIVENLLCGNIPLTPAQKKKLQTYRATLRKLVQKGEGWTRKKEHLQRGGAAFLPLLISLASALLPSLLK